MTPMVVKVRRDSGVKRLELSVDRISMLPDTLICHIMSFLPMEDVVRTCLLSPRWKSLWKITSSLHFRVDNRSLLSGNEMYLSKFVKFINRVLLLHDLKSIEKISIEFDALYPDFEITYSENLDNWVATGIARNVKNFRISGDSREASGAWIHSEFRYPSVMFMSNSLETLDLSNFGTLDPPRVVRLPNVKTLRLVNVDFSSDESVERLISGCTSLLTLYVRGMESDNVATFRVQSRTLEDLTIITTQYYTSANNLLLIRTPALKSFCIDGAWVEFQSLENLNLLCKAKITLESYSRAEPCLYLNLIGAIHPVKLLHLDASAFRVVGHLLLDKRFLQLTQLTAEIDYESTLMWDALECMPSLENLTLKGTSNMDDDDVPLRVIKHRKVPGCLTSSLKMVSVEKFSGRRDQVAMLGHILENASLLQTMTVMTGSMDIEGQYNFIRQLSKFRRSSVMCSIEFS